MKRMRIITGHYGSGKTEYAVNLAMDMAKNMEHVVLADLDIVNPYFRSFEQTKMLEDAGVKVIVTSCGGVADIPALNPAVMSVFQDEKWNGVLDIGGDPIGARVLARFAHQIHQDEYDLLFVLNANRPETKDVESALQYMRGIEAECHLKVTGIVNNTHLCGETTAEEILKGAALAQALSERTSLPVIHHAVQKKFVQQVQDKLNEPVLPMNIYMKKPWEIIFCEEE
jgi:Mrp family chromosome partitioning ATPase